MPVARARELTVVFAAAGIIAIGTVAAAILLPPAADSLPRGSSFSHAPSGAAGAYLMLRAVGYDVRRSFEPMAIFAEPPLATALVIADPAEPASTQDRRAIQTFLAGGGTVLATGCAGATFFSKAVEGIGEPFPARRRYRARIRSPLTAGAPEILMTSGCVFRAPGPHFTPLYTSDEEPVVFVSQVGRGLAMWWAGTTPIENAAIEEPGHVELLLNVLGPTDRVIVWDEFYHGQRRSLWAYLSRTPLLWGLAQIGIVVLAAAGTYVRRRTPVRTPFGSPRTSPLEFVETMAALYSRAGSATTAVALARTRLRRLLLESTGIAATAGDAELAAAAAPRVSMPADDLHRLLELAERAAADPGTSQQAAVTLVRRMQHVAAALHGV